MYFDRKAFKAAGIIRKSVLRIGEWLIPSLLVLSPTTDAVCVLEDAA